MRPSRLSTYWYNQPFCFHMYRGGRRQGDTHPQVKLGTTETKMAARNKKHSMLMRLRKNQGTVNSLKIFTRFKRLKISHSSNYNNYLLCFQLTQDYAFIIMLRPTWQWFMGIKKIFVENSVDILKNQICWQTYLSRILLFCFLSFSCSSLCRSPLNVLT